MIFREAHINDIKQIQVVRNAVKENRLSNPSLVTDEDCEKYLFRRGKGWVCLADDVVVGFSIVDLQDKNIWALFVHPDFENLGIGKRLHNSMLDWYFKQSKEMGNFDFRSGNTAFREQIIAGVSEAEIRKSWEPGLSAFKVMRKKHLLYP